VKTHYILVKVEAEDIEAVIGELHAALDSDNIYKSVNNGLVIDINNDTITTMLDQADLMSSIARTRNA
jgi:hypothetical protein